MTPVSKVNAMNNFISSTVTSTHLLANEWGPRFGFCSMYWCAYKFVCSTKSWYASSVKKRWKKSTAEEELFDSVWICCPKFPLNDGTIFLDDTIAHCPYRLSRWDVFHLLSLFLFFEFHLLARHLIFANGCKSSSSNSDWLESESPKKEDKSESSFAKR